jgi:hypothetical protein
LQLACEAWDRSQEARALLDKDGLTIRTDGGLKAHPAVATSAIADSLSPA